MSSDVTCHYVMTSFDIFGQEKEGTIREGTSMLRCFHLRFIVAFYMTQAQVEQMGEQLAALELGKSS